MRACTHQDGDADGSLAVPENVVVSSLRAKPAGLAGNLLAPAGYLHAFTPHNKDEKNKNDFQVVQNDDRAWPKPSMFAALARVHVKPVMHETPGEKPDTSLLAMQLRGGNAKLQDLTLMPEKKRA